MKFFSIFPYFALFITFSCASTSQELDPKVFYKRDMQVKVNGLKGDGILVVPRKTSYNFDITAQGKLDLFTFSTCHREQTREKAGKKGWFADKKRRKLTYVPAPIEAEPASCPVELGGFEKKKGRHSWAFIDFEHPETNLMAHIACNGNVYKSNGVTVCQAYAGSIQEITFTRPVLAAEKNVCTILKSKNSKKFRYKMPKGRCTFRFVTKTGEEKWHRLTTLGYEKILIREL